MPQWAHSVIVRFVDAGASVETCCRLVGVSRQGYYRFRKHPTSSTQWRRQWLTCLTREVPTVSRGTSWYRRIHAELTIGMGTPVQTDWSRY